MSIKLSICIPTYNRANYLKETLDSIVNQLDDEVEIAISDNASTDHTKELVIEYQKKYSNIVYYQSNENKGPDRNYYNAIKIASGEFCWLLGSDDLITSDAIKRVKDQYIQKISNIDFILVTSEVYDIHLKKFSYYSKDELNITSDLYYDNPYDFFVRFFCESGLSGYIVRRNLWINASHEKYLDTGLLYLGLLYEYLKPKSKILVIEKPCVIYRSGNGCWTSDLFKIQTELMRSILDNLPKDYASHKEKAWKNYKERIPITLKQLLGYRLLGIYSYSEYVKYLSWYYTNPFKKPIAILIAFFPKTMLKTLKQLVKGKNER